MECASSEPENTDEEFERRAAGSEDSTDEGDTGDEKDRLSGPFRAPSGVTFYEALPSHLGTILALALSIAHTLSTGWEKGRRDTKQRPQTKGCT